MPEATQEKALALASRRIKVSVLLTKPTQTPFRKREDT